MKTIAAILIILLQTSTSEGSLVKKRAVVRDENFNALIAEVALPNLVNDYSYEGKYFKIVKGKSDDAISFNDLESLQLKAATTYYHLNKARTFFVDVVKSKYVKDLPQITIRLDLINVFNEIGHFANDNLDPQFNNALSVPAGLGYEPKDIPPWNAEIWFRPSKEIYLKQSDAAVIKAALVNFRNQFHMLNFQQFLTSLLEWKIAGNTYSVNSMMRVAESSLMIEAIFQSTGIAADFFSQKIYRLDSGLVPEIIYHEFSHIALSDHLQLTHSTPVNEGLADFFAGKIANSKFLATKIKSYNLFNGKQVKKNQQYRLAFEQGEYANTDFVFGLLWNVGELIGHEQESSFMYSMANHIDTNVSIRDGLIEATLTTCKEFCKYPLSDRIRLYKLYHSYNM
jgi:hypothetical protein